MNTKDLINTLKQVDTKYHYDIFHILKKYDIKYTKNNNGFFFNMDQIDQSILDEVYNYLEMCALYNNKKETTGDHNSLTCDSEVRNIDFVEKLEDRKNNDEVDNDEIVKKCNNKTLNEECENIVKNVINDDTLKVSKILHEIEKEKSFIHKKTAINKFSVAKKKYAKQVITNTGVEHHEVHTILDFDK